MICWLGGKIWGSVKIVFVSKHTVCVDWKAGSHILSINKSITHTHTHTRQSNPWTWAMMKNETGNKYWAKLSIPLNKLLYCVCWGVCVYGPTRSICHARWPFTPGHKYTQSPSLSYTHQRLTRGHWFSLCASVRAGTNRDIIHIHSLDLLTQSFVMFIPLHTHLFPLYTNLYLLHTHLCQFTHHLFLILNKLTQSTHLLPF